jgi:hypothetical protein
LRNANLANIRIDSATGLGSVIDTIRQLGVDTSNSASSILSRFLDLHPNYRSKVTHMQSNGLGRMTPVADACTLVVISLWLETKEARAVRECAASTLTSALAGSKELVNVIERRRATAGPLELSFRQCSLSPKEEG